MAGSVSITTTPTVYTLFGGGSNCAGDWGRVIYLSGSQVGVSYQLYVGGMPVGLPFPGNNGTISFGQHPNPGTYTVVANPGTSSATTMSGSVAVSTSPLPAVYTVTGGGYYNGTGPGLPIGLSGSQTGVLYALYRPPFVAQIPGTGAPLSYGMHTTPGYYTVFAANATTSCATDMSGYTIITTVASPTVYAVTGGGSYCAGGAGVTIGLTGSQAGAYYQLYNGAAKVGLPVAGTGTAISFGLQTATGIYTVVANPGVSGSVAMSGSATVSITPLPHSFTVTGGGFYSGTGPGVSIGLTGSQPFCNYQLYLGTTVAGMVSGTGSALSFGLFTTAGTYTIASVNTTTGCVQLQGGNAVITNSSSPTVYTVTGGGSFCSGGTGVYIGLNGSQPGVTYELHRGGFRQAGPISGSGAPINFGIWAVPGTYTVIANAGTSTATTMAGSASVSMSFTPFMYSVSGGGGYCPGGPGLSVVLSNSQTAATYQLYNGTTPVGTVVSGTGSSMSFGPFTTTGTYTIVGNPGTACATAMSGNATIVTGTSSHTLFSVLGGGTYCAGGAGVVISLSGSQAGISYQLYNGITAVGPPVTGTGAPISFGMQTATGTYTVVAGTVCTTTMTGSATISILPSPTDHPLTNSGSYCSGGGGIVVALTGSDIGVNYQLYRTTSSGTVSIGTPLAGTGAAISFGGHTIAGLYTIIATSTTTACTRTLTSTVTLIFHAPPAPIPISGGGTYCSGGAGVAITMPASAVGVNYQLYRGTTPVGSPVPGVGSSLSFGLQTVPGAYTVVATDMTTGCTRNMTGTVSVAVVASPTAFAMTGGGGYCTGGPGMPVGISGSQTGVNYQLYRSGMPISGTTRPGSGSAISFGMQTIAGTYTAVAISTSTFCSTNMTGSAVVTINAVTTYTVTGGGTYCAGGTGVVIGLNGSSTGVNYQLKRGTTLVGSPVAGSGGAISFGPQTIAGTYTVVATNLSSGCIANMAGGASVVVNTVPVAYTVTGGGNFCSGSTGVPVGLSGSQTAVLYQLRIGGIPTGSPVAGTGAPINFGLKTTPGAYTVSATTVGGCTNSMTGSVTVSVNPTPAVFTMGGGGSYCTGGSGIIPTLSTSTTGVNYQLLRGTTTAGSPVAGTGGPLSFGMQTVAGTYTIRATNATTGCTAMMSGSTTISLLPPPTIVPVTGGGGYCSGGTGVAIGLGGAVGGTSYQLYRGGVPVGSPVMGSVGLTFGLQTAAGTYTVVATNSTGCTATMSGSATVTVYALPTIYTVTGGGGYCSGGTGVNIGLSGSSTGTSYRLYRGVVPVSSFIPGTGSALNFGLYPTSGTYTVIATNSVTGCTATMSGSATVSVNPVPTYTSTRYTVAPAGTITLNATPSGGNWTSSTISVATIGSASGIVTGVTLGTTTISYTLPTGCRATRTMAVTPTGFRANEAGTTAISNTFENSKLSIIPNPNHGTFSIKGQLTTPADVYAEIVNILGQKVYSNMIATDNGEIDREISLPADIARGMYILTLSNENERQTFRVIIE
jgi:hypothetical protein